MRVLLLGGYKPYIKALKRGLEEEGFAVDDAHGHEGNHEDFAERPVLQEAGDPPRDVIAQRGGQEPDPHHEADDPWG